MSAWKPGRGFTLIEMLLVLAIVLLIAALSSALLSDVSARMRAKSTGASLQEFIALARNEALFRQQIVTLCPLDAGNRCSSNWHEPLVQFIDPNSNAQIDGNEEILKIWKRPPGNAEISWRNQDRFMRFRPNGSTTALTGSLRYCATHKTEVNSFRIVVARTGRARIEWRYAECL